MIDNRCVLDTGTWLKLFKRMPTKFGLLPAIYTPAYCLNYFRISEEDSKILIEYKKIDKSPPSDLTLFRG